MPYAEVRPLRACDAGAVLAAFAEDPEMARQGSVTNVAEAEAYVERHLDPPRRAWVVEAQPLVEIGFVAVSVDAENRNGWLSYWAHPALRGRGWMTQAVATVADHLLATDLERLELGHRANNPASGAVATAAGFVREGREREKFLLADTRIDVLTYGRLRTDPTPDTPRLPLRESTD